MEIKDITIEQTIAEDADYLILQNPTSGLTYRIKKSDFLAGLSINGSSNENIITNGLIGDYRFNEMSGSVVTDNSSSQNNGTITGSTSWLTYANTGLDLQNSGCVTLPSSVWVNGDLSIEAVFNLRSYQNWSRIIDFGNGEAADNFYFAASKETTGKPAFGVLNGNGANPFITSSIAVPLNTWSHWLVTLSGATCTIFSSLSPVAGGTTLIPDNAIKTYNAIGRSAFSGDGKFDGVIATVRIWNRVLSTSERIQQFLATRSMLGNQGIIF
ncbi:MAG: LamG domain-containing protein [Nostoc sp.]